METERAKPSFRPNYVTLKQLQELRLREKQQRDEEEERFRKLKEAEEEEEKLRRPEQEEEEKRRKEEELLRPPRGAPNSRKAFHGSRSGHGLRSRNADPEAREAKDAGGEPIEAATGSSNPEGDDRAIQAMGPEEKSVNPEAKGGANVGDDLIGGVDRKKKKKKKKSSNRRKMEENRTGPEGADRSGLRVKGEFRTVNSEPDRTAETSQSQQIGNATKKWIETLDPKPDRGPESTVPNRNRSRGNGVKGMGRFGEPRASGGDETSWAERGRWKAGRGRGRFGRASSWAVGPREGLVWVKKESVS